MAVISLSLDESIITAARERAVALGFKSFSAYVQAIVRADLLERGPMHLSDAPSSSATVRALADEAASHALQAAQSPKPASSSTRYSKPKARPR